MQRRDFISKFYKLSLFSTTAALGSTMLATSKDVAEKSRDSADKQMKLFKEQIDNLEINQQKTTKALIILAGLSTGIDLTLIL